MCGITGYYLLEGNLKGGGVVQRMMETIRHRGPDDEGHALFAVRSEVEGAHDLALGHLRLSILDLSKDGRQPMFSEKERFCIVFNGEIYNYLELKEKLEAKGHSFKTKTDTEVLLKCYEEYGVSCLQKLNGMWAFVIYDKEEKSLFCARDRFGIKPFYYAVDDEKFVFGSEMKSILTFPGVKASINKEQITKNLIQGYRIIDGHHQTFLNGVQQLKGAEYMLIDLKKPEFKPATYWRVDLSKKIDLPEEDVIKQFRELLIDSVRIRLRSDVPYTFALSGGMDSSSIVSISKRVLERETVAFSAVYEKGSKYDEQEFITATTEDLGIKHYFIKPKLGNFFENLQEMIAVHDEPVPSVTFYSEWQVMKQVKETGYTVILTGIGADEIVSGYYDHYLYNFCDLDQAGEQELLEQEVKAWIKNHDTPEHPKSREEWTRFKTTRNNDDFLYPKMHRYKELFKEADLKRYAFIKPQSQETSSLLTERMYNELTLETVPSALRPEDRNSMMFSLESRVPFLDYRLVEFAYSIPNRLKVRNGVCKYVLREAIQGIVNEKVRTRKQKMGFNAPMYEWMLNELRGKIESLLEGEMRLYRYIKQDVLRSLWEEHKREEKNHMMLFWNVLNIEYWMRYLEERFNITS